MSIHTSYHGHRIKLSVRAEELHSPTPVLTTPPIIKSTDMVANSEPVATRPSRRRASPSNPHLPPAHPNCSSIAVGHGQVDLLADVALRYAQPRKLASLPAQSNHTQNQLPSIAHLTGETRGAPQPPRRPSPTLASPISSNISTRWKSHDAQSIQVGHIRHLPKNCG